MLVRFRRQNWRRAVSIGGATVIAPFLGGCANTWDNITSQHFRDDPIHWMFHTDDPMWVLRNVEEGDRRAKAMLAVKEPKTNGGSIADQEELMKILSESAVSDKHSICRLNAIEARDDLEKWIAAAGDEELLKEAALRVRIRVEPRTWDAFRLLALEGRSGAEAAKMLGMKVGTLFVARSKAQRMLREELARLEPQ